MIVTKTSLTDSPADRHSEGLFPKMRDGPLLIAVMGAFLLLAACSPDSPTPLSGNTAIRVKEPILIGADFGLSGAVAQYGSWARRGATMAMEEINAEGGVSGMPIRILFEDNRGSPSEAVTAYRRLRIDEGVHYVLTYQSSIALAVAPLMDQDRVLQMDVSATTGKYSTPDDLSYRTGVSASQLAQEEARIMESRGVTEIAYLFINNEFGQGMRDAFGKRYRGSILDVPFDENANDYRTPLLKIKEKGFHDIVLTGHMKESGLIASQASVLGMNVSILSDVYGIEGSDFLIAAGASAEGIEYVAPAFDVNSSDPAVARFVAGYRSRFREDPTVFAAQSYDGVISIAKAMISSMSSSAGSCEPMNTSCVKAAMDRLDFQGASGRIRFDRNGDVQKGMELRWIHDGKFVARSPVGEMRAD